MKEWLILGLVIIVSFLMLLRGLTKSNRYLGGVLSESKRKDDDLEAIGKSLRAFTKAMGKPTAKGRDLVARWRARMRD
jgi:hypothetical protein